MTLDTNHSLNNPTIGHRKVCNVGHAILLRNSLSSKGGLLHNVTLIEEENPTAKNKAPSSGKEPAAKAKKQSIEEIEAISPVQSLDAPDANGLNRLLAMQGHLPLLQNNPLSQQPIPISSDTHLEKQETEEGLSKQNLEFFARPHNDQIPKTPLQKPAEMIEQPTSLTRDPAIQKQNGKHPLFGMNSFESGEKIPAWVQPTTAALQSAELSSLPKVALPPVSAPNASPIPLTAAHRLSETSASSPLTQPASGLSQASSPLSSTYKNETPSFLKMEISSVHPENLRSAEHQKTTLISPSTSLSPSSPRPETAGLLPKIATPSISGLPQTAIGKTAPIPSPISQRSESVRPLHSPAALNRAGTIEETCKTATEVSSMKTAPTADNVSPSEEMVHPNSSTSPTHPAVAKGEAQKSVVERTNTSLPPPDATHRPPDVRVSSIGFQSATHSSGWIKTTPQPPAASTAALLLPIGKTINVSKNIAVPALARTIVKPTMAQPNQPDRTPLNTKATVLENPAEVVDEEIAPEAEYTAIMYERPNIIEDYYGIGRV